MLILYLLLYFRSSIKSGVLNIYEQVIYCKQGQYKQTVKKDKMNPVNKSGHISRCVICDSKMHWASQCPHAQNNTAVHITEEIDNELCEQVELVLITEELDKHKIFVAEASKSAVLDTACTKTVAGVTWFNNFVETLTHKDLRKWRSSRPIHHSNLGMAEK